MKSLWSMRKSNVKTECNQLRNFSTTQHLLRRSLLVQSKPISEHATIPTYSNFSQKKNQSTFPVIL